MQGAPSILSISPEAIDQMDREIQAAEKRLAVQLANPGPDAVPFNEALASWLPRTAPEPEEHRVYVPTSWFYGEPGTEHGPGIASLDLTPKRPDYSAWCDETDLLPDAD